MEWKKIDEDTPEDVPLIVYVPEFKRACIGTNITYRARTGWVLRQTPVGQVRRDYQPTHWMPLPKPPMDIT